MRKIIGLIFILVVITFCIDSIFISGNEISLAEILRNSIDNCRFETSQDSTFGYEISHPDFFVDSSQSAGHPCFRYQNGTNIVVEAFVADSISDILAYSKILNKAGGSLILQGKFYENGSEADNYCFHAKAVKKGRLWVVYRLIYSTDFAESVERIRQRIDCWQP
jgi:hypothetical protein